MRSPVYRRVLLAALALALVLQPLAAFAATPSALAGRADLRLATGILPQAADDDFATAPVKTKDDSVTDQLGGGDYEDIFAIDLAIGDRIKFEFTGNPGLDGGASLVKVNNLAEYDIEFLTSTQGEGYPAKGSFVVSTAGRYYLIAEAYSGFAGYTMSWETVPADVDDYTPGVPLPSGPSTSTLHAVDDDADVYRRNLVQGERIWISIDTTSKAEFELLVFKPGTTDIRTAEPAGYGTWDEYPRKLVYTAPAAGEYYFVAMAYDGGGVYQLDVESGAPPAKTYIEVKGDNRYLTAIEASKKTYPTGSKCVVIATGLNWPDALGGAALAAVKDAPILLTNPNTLNLEVSREITRLGATEAIILGRSGAVSDNVYKQVDKLISGPLSRIGGTNRYHTADLIARKVAQLQGEDFMGECFITTGLNFPDALAASPVSASLGMPILLTAPQGLSKGTKDTMSDIGVGFAVILGGEGAVPGDIEDDLMDSEDVFPFRLEGDSRYETAAAIAEYGWQSGLTYDKVAIATGANFPDALAAGAMQAKSGSLLLLTPSGSLDQHTKAALFQNRWDIDTVRFMGGLQALTKLVRDRVKAAVATPKVVIPG